MFTSSKRTFIVGIGGPTCAGKSALAEKVSAKLGGQVLSLRSYYRDLSQLMIEERAQQNFDVPESFDFELLNEHVAELSRGHSVNQPSYEFSVHNRAAIRTACLSWKPVLIVAGTLALHWPELRRHFDLSVYLDAPDDVCFHRRKVRDIVERQRTREFILSQYESTVRPMTAKYVLPTRALSNLVLDAQKPSSVVESELTAAIRMKIGQKLDEI